MTHPARVGAIEENQVRFIAIEGVSLAEVEAL